MKILKSDLFVYLIFFVFSIILAGIFFDGMGKNQFIYIGDQFLRFNFFDTISNAFALRKWESLGIHNGWQYTVQFWDVWYFLIVYAFGASVQFSESLLFLLIIFLSLSISFFGFSKWYVLLFKMKNTFALVGVTFWYCFNPYAVMLWHGGVYSLGAALTYSIAPLLFYLFYFSLFKENNVRLLLLLALLIWISSFVFWLFAPLGFVLGIFYLFLLLFHIKRLKVILKNTLLLVVFCVLLTSPYLFAITHELFNNSDAMNATFAPTFGNQQGGLLYSVLFLYSWGIYTVWFPRAMYSFGSFYFSEQYIFSIVGMYISFLSGIVWYFYNKISELSKKGVTYLRLENSVILIVFLFILLVSIFFAKGSQPPYGGIFLYLYDNLPLFSVFRTPDIRFGFTVVLSIALVAVVISKYIHTLLFALMIFTFTYFQSSLFFNGVAIKGENVEGKYYDRIIKIPDTYKEITSYINSHNIEFSYVLAYPLSDYGRYQLDGDLHFGQDFLSKNTNKPFIYLSESGSISSNSYYRLKTIIDNGQYEDLTLFPIEYILLRKDIYCTVDCTIPHLEKLLELYKPVVSNKDFTLLYNPNFRPLISGDIISYEIINPTAYTFKVASQTKEVFLSQSYNENWKLYRYNDFNPFLGWTIRFNPFLRSENSELLQRTHSQEEGYGNSWRIKETSMEGSKYYVLYYPQVVYNFLLLVCYVSLGSFLYYLLGINQYIRLFILRVIGYYKV